MRWYAETPVRRTRQLTGDALVLLWVLLWFLAGRWVHGTVGELADPADQLRSAGTSLEGRMREVATEIAGVPLVGGQLTSAFEEAAGVGTDLALAADTLQTSVDRLALLAGVLTAVLPVLLVGGWWLWSRWRYAVQADRLARQRERPELTELLALRALVGRPADVLVGIDPDPVGAWRRRDPGVVGRLADLELQGWGLRGVRHPERVSNPVGPAPG